MTESITRESQPIKRQSCRHCLRPKNACICQHICATNNQISLIILQHPIEINEPKNTARLLHLCLKNSHIHVGEQFSDAFFSPRELSAEPNTQIYDVLLYPETQEEKSLGILTPLHLDRNSVKTGDKSTSTTPTRLSNNIRLWVIDATWRKSRKMLYLNPSLQKMPRLTLINCPATIYSIRRAHSENQLSTLEASCYALAQLEQGAVDYTPVLKTFANFVEQQKMFIPNSPDIQFTQSMEPL